MRAPDLDVTPKPYTQKANTNHNSVPGRAAVLCSPSLCNGSDCTRTVLLLLCYLEDLAVLFPEGESSTVRQKKVQTKREREREGGREREREKERERERKREQLKKTMEREGECACVRMHGKRARPTTKDTLPGCFPLPASTKVFVESCPRLFTLRHGLVSW